MSKFLPFRRHLFWVKPFAMRIVLFLVLFFAFSTYPAYVVAAQQASGKKVFNAQTFTLKNGMQVVVIPNHRVPVVTHMVWYKVGAIDEPKGQSGIAHFVEHLMFKGSPNVPPGAFSTRVKAMGGNDNAMTSQDFTAYHQTVTVDHLPDVMALEADRMRGLLFPPEDVKSERDVVIEERRQRTENDPRAYFGEQLMALLFINHPYGNPVSGWLHEVDALTRDNVKAFYETWYAPNNAILIVSGDMTAEKLKPLAEKYYGVIPVRAVPGRRWTDVPPLIALPQLTLRHPVIRQPQTQRICRVPSFLQSREDSRALELLENIMDGSAATRLYRSLVVEQKIATDAGFSYDGAALSDGTLWISATPADGKTPEILQKAIDDELRKLIRDGVTKEELREAKDRINDKSDFMRDTLMGPAMLFGQVLTAGGTIDDLEFRPQQIESVTAAQVQDVARRFLDPDNYGTRPCVTGILLPPEEAKKQ